MVDVEHAEPNAALPAVPARSIGRVAAALALAMGVILGVSADGGAGTGATARLGPQFPETVTLGETFQAAIVIQNQEANPVVFRNIELIAACSPQVNCPEPTMITLDVRGTGIAGPRRCRGTWAIEESSPGVYRFTPPLRQSALSVDPGVFCIVRFTATAKHLPTDALPAAGVQTVQILQADRGRVAAHATEISGTDFTTVVEPEEG